MINVYHHNTDDYEVVSLCPSSRILIYYEVGAFRLLNLVKALLNPQDTGLWPWRRVTYRLVLDRSSYASLDLLRLHAMMYRSERHAHADYVSLSSSEPK